MAGFDPDAYLKAQQTFDPDAYLGGTPRATAAPVAQIVAHAPERPVSAGADFYKNPSAIQQKLAEGFVPGWNRLDAAVGAALAPLVPSGKASEVMFGDQNFSGTEGFGNRYNARLQQLWKQSDRARAAAPVGAGAATIVGALPWMLTTGQPLTAPTALGRVGQAAGQGALFGGTYAYGDARAPLFTDAAARQGLAGATMGAATGGTLQGLSELAPPMVDALRKIAIEQGRKTLTGNTAPMATRKPLSPEAIQASYDVGAIQPFGTVEKAAQRLAEARGNVGERYSQIISDLEGAGVKGPDATALALKMLGEADKVSTQTLGSPTPGLFRSIAEELASKPTDLTGRLGLSQAENMKRALQQAAQNDYVREGSQSMSADARMAIAGRMRQAVEDSVQAQASLAPEQAAAFEPVKLQLSRLIEASNAANKGAARAANRQTHGLGAKQIAAGALAHGGALEAAPALFAATAARNRGPATIGWAANKAANVLGSAPSPSGPPLTPEVAALLEAMLARKPQIAAGVAPAAAADNEQ